MQQTLVLLVWFCVGIGELCEELQHSGIFLALTLMQMPAHGVQLCMGNGEILKSDMYATDVGEVQYMSMSLSWNLRWPLAAPNPNITVISPL